jgi:ABC-type lipoprotein release transport system permease subunit
MGAVIYRARADLRARWRATLSLTLLVGLAGAVSIAAFAGARRTQSAYPRFLAASHADDVSSNTGAPGVGFDYHYDAKAAISFPEVERARIDSIFFIEGRADNKREIPSGQYALQAGPTTHEQDGVDVPKLLSGHLPDPSRADEISVAFPAAAQFGLHPGSKIDVSLYSPVLIQNFNFVTSAPVVARVPVTVAGIVAVPGGFPPLELYWSFYGTPAFYRAYRSEAAVVDTIHVRLKRGSADLSTFKTHLDSLANGAEQFQTQIVQTGSIERPMRLYATLLMLFGVITAASSAFMVSQLVGRQAGMDGTESLASRALGMTTPELVGVSLIRAGLMTLGALIVSIVAALALSPIFPIGGARFAEPKPGVQVDWFVLGIGLLAIATLVITSAVIGAWRATRDVRTDAPSGQTRPSLVANQLANFGAPVPLVAGARLALERGRGSTATPVRSAVAASIAGVAALCTALVMTASVQHFVATPRLFGIGWDAEGGNPYGHDLSRVAPKILEKSSAVAAYSSGTVLVLISVDGDKGRSVSVSATALDLSEGIVTPPIVEGRWPTNNYEVALGTTTMRQLGVQIGSTVRTHVKDRALSMRVVGRAVFPQASDQNAPGGFGEGVGVTFQALRRLVPNAQENVFPIDFAPGVNRSRLPADLASLGQLFPFQQFFAPPSDLADLARARGAPLAAAAVLALLAAATSAHLMVTSVRRRRRDLAVLMTLGLIRRQVRAAIAWQATSLAVVALLVGVPVGIVIGRTTWTVYANSLGIVPEPVIPAALLALVAGGAIVLVNLTAVLPARAAAHMQPAMALRAE